MDKIENLMDSLDSKKLPRVYKFNQLVRWFTLILGTTIIVFTLWHIFFQISPDVTKFKKIIPFIILFLTLNSVLKNLFLVNSIYFTKNFVKFRYIARKSVIICWSEFRKMEFKVDKRQKSIKITYVVNDLEKSYLLSLSFPNMLEIVNGMAELAPQTVFDEFLKNVIITDKEKQAYKIKVKNLDLKK
ncbi:MAG: hypothetical protein K8S23_02610 [Candidatus Cloacimonetes bacterium]|nr:hypothetical protein [Candidatus Cloacimonadota bacterium]